MRAVTKAEVEVMEMAAAVAMMAREVAASEAADTAADQAAA